MAWPETRDGKIRGGYRDATGRRRYGSRDPNTGRPFSTERAAMRWASAKEEEARRGTARDPQGPRMRWGAWCDVWYPTRSTESSTERGSEPKLRRHVRPRWDDVKLGEVSRLDVQRWVNDLSRAGVSASSVRQCYYLLSSSMKAALAHGLIDVTPCQAVKLPALPQGVERYLADDEVAAVFSHLGGVRRMTVELLLATGLRMGEAGGLHWSRMDLERQTLDVVEVWDAPTHLMKAYPKSRKRRTVPLTDELTQLLRSWADMRPPGPTCGREHAAGSVCRSSVVLQGDRGAPLDGHNFTETVWGKAVELAGIGHCRPHDLRHTYASRLLTAGVGIERVSKLLGHGSVKTTERYAHLIDEGHDEVRAALSGRARSRGTGRGTDRLRAVPDPSVPLEERHAL